MKNICAACFIVMLMMFGAGCSNSHVYTYAGESENWRANSTIQGNDDILSYRYTIQYIGEDAGSIERIKYKFISRNISVREDLPFDRVIERRGDKNVALLDEPEFVLEIDWNGQTERIQVQKQ